MSLEKRQQRYFTIVSRYVRWNTIAWGKIRYFNHKRKTSSYLSIFSLKREEGLFRERAKENNFVEIFLMCLIFLWNKIQGLGFPRKNVNKSLNILQYSETRPLIIHRHGQGKTRYMNNRLVTSLFLSYINSQRQTGWEKILRLTRVTSIVGLPPRLTSFWIISSLISSNECHPEAHTSAGGPVWFFSPQILLFLLHKVYFFPTKFPFFREVYCFLFLFSTIMAKAWGSRDPKLIVWWQVRVSFTSTYWSE